MKAISGALLVLLALSSCSSVPTAQELTGMWASSPPAAQLNATYCFGSDGSVLWTSQVQGRTRRVRGTYKLAGDALTIESPDLENPVKVRASLSLGKLVLTTASGSTQKYAKEAGSCDDSGR